jgi:hypothetical protein
LTATAQLAALQSVIYGVIQRKTGERGLSRPAGKTWPALITRPPGFHGSWHPQHIKALHQAYNTTKANNYLHSLAALSFFLSASSNHTAR